MEEKKRNPKSRHLVTYWPFYLALLGFLSGFLVPERYPDFLSFGMWVTAAIACMAATVFSALAVLRGKWWVRVIALGLLVLFSVTFFRGTSTELKYRVPAWPVSMEKDALRPCYFNSTVAFRVRALTTERYGWVFIGETPAKEPMWIPPCLSWRVEPQAPVNMDAVVREIEKEKIRGLKLRNATDIDLRSLEGVEELRDLYLGDCKAITDVGLTHVSKILGLHGLDVSYTGVTDAGLRHLEALKELRWIDITKTGVTAHGLELLKKRFPELIVRGEDAMRW